MSDFPVKSVNQRLEEAGTNFAELERVAQFLNDGPQGNAARVNPYTGHVQFRAEPKFQAGDIVRWGSGQLYRVVCVQVVTLHGTYYQVRRVGQPGATPVQAGEDNLELVEAEVVA